MLRQAASPRALCIAAIVVVAASLAACGIKGPLRPPPAIATPPPIINPATPPATTSPALTPPTALPK